MQRRIWAWLLVLMMLMPCTVMAEGEKRVFRVDEEGAVPFAPDAETFDLYVCPLMGADCMVLMSQGQTMLVDMGKEANYPTIRAVLEDLNIARVDIAFNSHPHKDHLGSMKLLMKDYEIGAFMTAFPEDYRGHSVIQSSTLKEIHAADIPVVRVGDGDGFALGGAKMTVIQHDRYEQANPCSAMLKIEYGACTMLLTGDLTGEAQLYIARNNDLKADVFKYPHHGLNKLATEFLEAIDAEYAFITHGYKDTLDAQKQLTKYGVAHDFATWGVIHLSSNGEYWLVEQALTEDGKIYDDFYRR